MNTIQPGQDVSINPQSDKTRKILLRGVIRQVLTRDQSHPHGVKVVLESGEIGRVKEVHSEAAPAAHQLIQQPSQTTIEDLLSSGENHFVEFKTSTLWSKFYTKEDIEKSKSFELKKYGQRASTFIIAKSIAGFTNADGGHLLIGIKEDKETDELEIVGIESELKKLKDQTIDGYRRMIADDVISRFLPNFFLHHINNYLRMEFPRISEKLVCHLHILKSEKPVFVKLKQGQLFVRIEASTREVTGEDAVNYCASRFVNQEK